jgi:hypothetical protein
VWSVFLGWSKYFETRGKWWSHHIVNESNGTRSYNVKHFIVWQVNFISIKPYVHADIVMKQISQLLEFFKEFRDSDLHSIAVQISINLDKIKFKFGCWWLTPVILATQEAEIRRVMVQSQCWQIAHETLCRKKSNTVKGWWSDSSGRASAEQP